MSNLTGTDQDLKFSEEFTDVNLTKWNPMLGDYSSKEFNSYFKPTAPEDFKAIYKTAQSPPSVQLESFSPTKGDKQDINLFIGNVPLSLSKEGLKSFLSQAAPVNSVRICNSKDPERGTTFGFARVTSPRDAENIIKRFNNYSFGTTSNLFVKLALSTEERERQREIQREEEEFYLNLYKDSKIEEKETSVAASESKSVKMHGSDANQAMPKRNSRICVCCNKPGSKQCARCKACYCSSDCQRMDWAKHQKQCLLVGSPNSKETSTSNASASNGEVKKVPNKNPGDIAEDSLLLAVDEMGIQENIFYYMNDLKAPKPLEPTIRVMIYVVDGLIMKGQAISETDTTALLQMTERLGKYVLIEPDLFQDGECKEGMLVIIDYHGEISRARVMECKTRSGEVEIFFIDYGNTEVCKVSDLKPLPEFALALPMQCREFTLHNMPEITDGNMKELLSQRLKELVQEKLLVAETKLSTHGTYQLIVTGEDGCIINELMLTLYKDLASKTVASVSQGATKSVTGSNSAQPVKWANDIPIEPLPKEPDFKIVVTDVKSPSLFFAQVVSADLSNLTELANISERLQEKPSANGSVFKPTQGQACIAFFPEDQMWYRASIESINNDGTIHVTYFDYGNTANIDTCFLRPISGEFLSLPRQARKFCLSGIKSSNADGTWSKAAIDLFREKASLEPCEVYNDGMVNDICQLRVYFSSDDCCADELLIKHGFAVSNGPAEQSNQPQAVAVNTEAKQGNIEEFNLKPRRVDVNDELRVVVVHVEDPDCLYVSVIEKEAVEKLMEYSGRLHEVKLAQLENPQPGDACVALYTDGDWYRANIVSVCKDSCVVFFSDYGNHSEIANTSLKIMPEEVRALPAQAVKVKLHDVMPRSDTNTWSDTGKEYFCALIADKICKLKVVSVEGDLAVCILIGEDDGCDFAKEIIKAGIAQNVKEVREKPRVEKFSLRQRKVNVNEELRAAVSHVEDPDCFYVNVIEREAVEKLMEYSGRLHEMKLSQLQKPQPGDVCVALYTDGDWYRAKVVSVGKDSCVVFFSDYGNHSEIANTSLKIMPEEVRSLPTQAVKVKLHDVMPVSDNNAWSDRAKEYFSGLIADKICILKVIAVADDVATCSAVCEDDGCDVAKEIVKAGFAKSASVTQQGNQNVKPVAAAQNSQKLNETSKNQGGDVSQNKTAMKEENKPVVQKKKEIAEPQQEEKPLAETKKSTPFTSFNKANGQATNAGNTCPEQKISKTEHNGKVSDSSESEDSNQKVNRFKTNRGRGRGRGSFGNRNQGTFGPPFAPFPFYPYMHFPVPSDEVESEGHSSDGNESKSSSKNKAALMKQQADFTDFMQQAQQMWAASMRGRGRGGARGGFNRSQNGFNDTKQHSKLPQEQIPSEYTRGASIEFIVSCIYSPSNFYIIKEGTNDKLPMETYQNAVAPATIEEGLICAVLVGGACYRGLVKRVYQEKISVKLVDSGRDKIVKRSALKRLVPEDFKRPFLAVRSVLHNATGLGKSRWSGEAINYFTHKIDIADRKMKGIVYGEVPSGLLLDIVDPENSKQLIVDDLVQLGLAAYMKSE